MWALSLVLPMFVYWNTLRFESNVPSLKTVPICLISVIYVKIYSNFEYTCTKWKFRVISIFE